MMDKEEEEGGPGGGGFAAIKKEGQFYNCWRSLLVSSGDVALQSKSGTNTSFNQGGGFIILICFWYFTTFITCTVYMCLCIIPVILFAKESRSNR